MRKPTTFIQLYKFSTLNISYIFNNSYNLQNNETEEDARYAKFNSFQRKTFEIYY